MTKGQLIEAIIPYMPEVLPSRLRDQFKDYSFEYIQDLYDNFSAPSTPQLNGWIPAADNTEEGLELIGFNPDWIHEDFNPEGTSACFMDSDRNWLVAIWDNYHDEWQSAYSGPNNENRMYKTTLAPTHVIPKPKPPHV